MAPKGEGETRDTPAKLSPKTMKPYNRRSGVWGTYAIRYIVPLMHRKQCKPAALRQFHNLSSVLSSRRGKRTILVITYQASTAGDQSTMTADTCERGLTLSSRRGKRTEGQKVKVREDILVVVVTCSEVQVHERI